jgi:hypothetical protein
MDSSLTPLISSPRRCAEFDYRKFIKPDPVAETNMLNARVNGGWMTPNEARAEISLPPIAGGDTLRIPAGATAPTTPVAPAGPVGVVPLVGQENAA